MEAMGRDSDRGPCSWSYYCGQQTRSSSYSIGSSSSGTIVSTAYTSSASRLSSVSMHLELDRERKIEELISALRANCGINGGGDSGVLERWLEHLGVGWVLHVGDSRYAGGMEHTADARSWILALTEVSEAIHSTASLFPDRGTVDLPIICEDEEKEEEEEPDQAIPDQFQFARFMQKTMIKMLPFVDAIAALDPCITRETFIGKYSRKNFFVCNGVPAYQKINILLRVNDALSDALSKIEASFLSAPSAQVKRTGGDMVTLLSAKGAKVREAIWSTLEEIRTRILESMELSTQTLQGSSDIHNVTWSVTGHITFLLDNYSIVDPIVSEAARQGKYVPRIGDLPSLDSMMMEMTSCLEQKLVNISESLFPHQGLGLLFLLNNLHFIRQQHFVVVMDLTCNFKNYMESYLQVSWGPLLSCLSNHPTPFCLFGKNYSQLIKFEYEFQKIYTTQKMWKVPDPELRKTLRQAIVNKVLPGYSKFIEDNSLTMPRFSPQGLEHMLQELFEG